MSGRPPNDMDVVTFYHLPSGTSQRQLAARAPQLIDRSLTRSTFKIDAYLVHLGMRPPERLARWSVYWYSVWSHRRDKLWKGFVQVDLKPDEDAAAEATLASLMSGGARS